MRSCLWCSASLEGRRADAQWCSVRCRTYFMRAQQGDLARRGRLCIECRRVIPPERKLNANTCSERCHRKRNASRRGWCAYCGGYFRQPKRSRAKYCSPGHRMAAFFGRHPTYYRDRYVPVPQVEPLPMPYVGHELFEQAAKAAGLDKSVAFASDWGQNDLLGEAVLALIEGRDAKQAVRAFRAKEKGHELHKRYGLADVGIDGDGNVITVKDHDYAA